MAWLLFFSNKFFDKRKQHDLTKKQEVGGTKTFVKMSNVDAKWYFGVQGCFLTSPLKNIQYQKETRQAANRDLSE